MTVPIRPGPGGSFEAIFGRSFRKNLMDIFGLVLACFYIGDRYIPFGYLYKHNKTHLLKQSIN